jgi:hypothetical protein
MKKYFGIAGLAVALAIASAPAEASSFLSIQVDGNAPVVCDNSVACGAGFTTSLNSNTITFNGTTLFGVTFGQIFLSGNSPGLPGLAKVTDTKSDLTSDGSAHTITVLFGQNNFTSPAGPANLSASQTGNWATSTSLTDQQTFTAWLRNDNSTTTFAGPSSTAPVCVTPNTGTTTACSTASPDVAVTSTSPFALTGRQIISLAAGSSGSFTGQVVLTPRAVPEPVTLSLLGAGLAVVAMRRRRQNG